MKAHAAAPHEAVLEMSTIPVLAPYVDQRTVLLTTYRRDGTPVGTPVHIAVEENRGYFRTYDTAGKVRRLGHTPEITIAPSTVRGRPTGPALRARARPLAGAEAQSAASALGRKYPLLHGVLIPWFHRMRGYRTVHYAIMATNGTGESREIAQRSPAPTRD